MHQLRMMNDKWLSRQTHLVPSAEIGKLDYKESSITTEIVTVEPIGTGEKRKASVGLLTLTPPIFWGATRYW